MLRAMGKAGGAKATTNFGACRDLYGRRLRHVNDEIRLKKWQEYQEAKRDAHGRGDKEALAKLENPEEATETGIRGWNLEIPKWADGVHKLGKANKMKRMRRMRRQARRGGAAGGAGQSAADGAAARRVGDGHKFNTLSRDDYVAGAAAPESEDAVANAVKEGIAASNAAKRRRLEQEGASEERFLPLQEGGVSGVPTLRWDEDSWLLAMAGDLVVQEGAVLEGALPVPPVEPPPLACRHRAPCPRPPDPRRVRSLSRRAVRVWQRPSGRGGTDLRPVVL